MQAFKDGGWGADILGVLSIIFGLLLLFSPLLGAIVLSLMIGVLGVIGGIGLIIVSCRFRQERKAVAAEGG